MAKVKLAEVSEIPEGGMIAKEHEGAQVMLAKVEGKIYAMNNVCTHRGAPLNQGELGMAGADAHLLTCPWHGAHFDIRTGKVYEDTPWARDTNAYEVEVKDGEVYIEI